MVEFFTDVSITFLYFGQNFQQAEIMCIDFIFHVSSNDRKYLSVYIQWGVRNNRCVQII